MTAPTKAEAELACEAVQKSNSFLGANGLRVKQPFDIYLVAEIPADGQRKDMLGCYRHLNGSVHVLALSYCQDVEGPFGTKMDRILYQGVLAHEIAHAIAAQHFVVKQPSLLAQEYIAYVTQLAILPKDRREEILGRFPDEVLRPGAASNVMLLAVDPGRFAAMAYRHYLKPGNGAAFIDRTISGEVLQTDIDIR